MSPGSSVLDGRIRIEVDSGGKDMLSERKKQETVAIPGIQKPRGTDSRVADLESHRKPVDSIIPERASTVMSEGGQRRGKVLREGFVQST